MKRESYATFKKNLEARQKKTALEKADERECNAFNEAIRQAQHMAIHYIHTEREFQGFHTCLSGMLRIPLCMRRGVV